jgi:hypothetical protein
MGDGYQTKTRLSQKMTKNIGFSTVFIVICGKFIEPSQNFHKKKRALPFKVTYNQILSLLVTLLEIVLKNLYKFLKK